MDPPNEDEVLSTPSAVEQETADERQNLITKCTKLETQVEALKEVAALRKTLLDLREKESKELISKLKYFEELVSNEKKHGQELSKRVTAAELECTGLVEKLSQNGFSFKEMKLEYETRVEDLVNKLDAAQRDVVEKTEENAALNLRLEEDKSKEFRNLEKQFLAVSERNRVLSFQMSMLNTLFSETESSPLDLDRVRAIGELVRESHQASDQLKIKVADVNLNSSLRKSSVDFDGINERLDASDINSVSAVPGQDSCYQSMESSLGPIRVLSISRTFIKIKDLILEKKSLKKEIDGLKILNDKLFKKVDKQEKRLSNVTTELNKTWDLVTTLEAEQHALHNSRSALRYELHQKRKLLDKIKTDLFNSHEKWTKVKQKNFASEEEWNSIRAEFARRRLESSSRQSQSQESAFCEGTSSSLESNSNEEIEITEEYSDLDLDKRKALEEPTFNDPIDDFVSEIVDEIEDIEAAVAEQHEEAEDDEDDTEVISGGDVHWDALVNRRAARLRLLEEQCRLLYNKLKASSARNTDLATKLSNLHDHYGSDSSSDHELLPEPETSPDEQVGTSSSHFANAQQMRKMNFAESTTAPESSTSNEFVCLSSQPQPSTSGCSSKNSLENKNKDPIQVDMGLPLLVPKQLTQNDILPPVQLPSEIKIETKTKTPNFKIPSPPQMPAANNAELNDGSARSSPDLNVLGRLIIQQLPKRLEILKQENSALIQQALERNDNIRETQLQLDCQKRMSAVLQDQIKDQSDTETKLRDELILLQQVIDRQNEELQVTLLTIENLGREKEKVDNVLDLFIKDRLMSENRSEVKLKPCKNCDSCNVRFTMLRRKYHCKGCGSGLCKQCTTNLFASIERTPKPVRLCSDCSERKQKLNAMTVPEAQGIILSVPLA